MIKRPLFGALKKIIHEDDINSFLKANKENRDFEFIESVLDYFNFDYRVSTRCKQNIPSSGKVVIIANHPLGSLDALTLIKLVAEVRKDIKVVANDMLMQIDNLNALLIPVDNMSGKSTKESIKAIYDSLKNEEALIVFPAGEVSRIRPTGIKDTNWRSGFLKFALKAKAPILPIFINAKNSTIFYTVSSINKGLSTMLLPNEMFNKHDKSIDFRVGELIPYESINITSITEKDKVDLLKRHLYKISKGKAGVFKTQRAITHPVEKKELKSALKEAKKIGSTLDNKKIYLYRYKKNQTILKEIGRLREYTFRKVGEGTGTKIDIDKYDYYYDHIILWDEENLEIVGSYRIANGKEILDSKGIGGFYSSTLFSYSKKFVEYLPDAIELGRSFVQPKYWGSRALDYLWQGIGAYLKNNPHIKYMYGPVSISDTYSQTAKSMLVYYYTKYYGTKSKDIVVANDKFVIEDDDKKLCKSIFVHDDEKKDFKALKENLSYIDALVPTLYKQYTELCEGRGVEFMGFSIDKDFGDCLDGFIFVKIDKVKESKRKRYIR
jgi:1-acyl-sn-glycerol-3-phosphate acyltransferase